MPGPLRADGPLDLGRESVVDLNTVVLLVRAGRVPQDRPQVELLQREQARAELALGGHPHAVAVVAERLGDARDHADVTGTVEVPGSSGGPRVDPGRPPFSPGG